MSNTELIDFDKLLHIKQANTRAQHELKSLGKGKFVISEKGKAVIGHTPEMGVDLRAGNGHVLLACRPKDDPLCTSGLLNGLKGNNFISADFEDHIKINGLLTSKAFKFEFHSEWNEGRYFKVLPIAEAVEETPEGDSVAEVEAVEASEPDGEVQEATTEGLVDAATKSNVAPVNDEF